MLGHQVTVPVLPAVQAFFAIIRVWHDLPLNKACERRDFGLFFEADVGLGC